MTRETTRPDAGRVPVNDDGAWPALVPDAAWWDSCATLQLWTQIVGKTRLALAPMQNHWWQVPLYVSARGLTTSRMPCGTRGVEVAFDFLDHELSIVTDDGGRWTMPLAPRLVADFYRAYLDGLRSLDVKVAIWPHPVEVPVAIPFAEDETHAAYDAAVVQRCWRAVAQADRVLHDFRSRFIGKCSPVHFFWGSFDLACTRFSGRTAPAHPGGVPNLGDWVAREAYSHECISAGWWPGTPDSAVPEPAFYAYAYPEPDGCAEAVIRPDAARYEWALREWVLPYAAVQSASDPDGLLLDFLQSTYGVAAGLGGWPRAVLERGG